jgi:hypothetical protein
MSACDLVDLETEALACDSLLKKSGNSRSSRGARTRVGTSGHRSSGQGSLNIPAPGGPLNRSFSRATSGSTS